ncbi:phosphatidate cytidylyltransferase [Sporolactobacillus shoreae]|uniref:Phosphatidate cytidylyltransferase n=1 Tax=Sporolactobacillus shoreae TaxID=1465501 RepID=A0A4Z0GVH9_9BACL|nr:phosphatidate cytidylyltransferase [Sporolactobacillus shoreae]TGB00312.1 phosphatidate cytidylyltransferase [Sporolactobacillus shoreae]
MRQRIITGFIAGALYLAFLFVGSIPFSIFIASIAVVSYLELTDMKRIRLFSPGVLAGASAVAATVLSATFMGGHMFSDLYIKLLILLVLILLGSLVFSKNRFHAEQASFIFFSVVYIGLPFYLLVQLRLEGLFMALFVQITMWATDSGAYFAGRRFGSHKLAPHISPKKTIEGSVGGVIAALAIAFIFQAIFRKPIFTSWEIQWTVAIVVSLLGQVGDLAESAIKRFFNVKDSGTVLPGHGGFLDRFDSLIFILPVLYLLGIIS